MIMGAPQDKPESFLAVSRWAGFISAAVGVAVLAGWAMDSVLLKSVGAGLVTMKANAAACFTLIGAALWLLGREGAGPRAALYARALAGTAAAVAFLTLSQDMFGFDLGIDLALFREDPSAGLWQAGRMAPATAMSFMMMALALLLSGRRQRWSHHASQGLALTTGLWGLMAVSGYIHEAPQLYAVDFGRGLAMAVHTAVTMAVVSAGLLSLTADRGLMKIITSAAGGGAMARRLLPVAVVLPLMMGILQSEVAARGLLSPNLTAALMVALLVISFAAVILVTAALMNRLDERRVEGELRYGAILDAALEGFLIVDTGGRILDVNESYCRMSGYSREELLVMGIRDLEAAEGPAEIAAHIGRIVSAGSELFKTRHRRKDGEVFSVEVSTQAGGLGGGVLAAFIRDITRREQAEAALRASAEELSRLSQALEQSPALAVITDLKGEINYVNPRFTEVTGYARAEVMGRNPRLLKTGKTPPEEYLELWQTIASGRVWVGEFLNRRKDGSRFSARASVGPLRNTSGDITGYLSLMEDITAQKATEASLQQARKLESIGRLAGGVAHDFNNLLTAVNGYTQFLLQGFAQDDPRRADAQEILATSARAAALTNQLLVFSRKQILDPRVVDLNSSINGAANLIKRLIGEDIQVAVRLSPRPCLVKVDAGQIDQVLLNLAVNARDAMPKGGLLSVETRILDFDEVPPAVQAVMARGPAVRLSVRDTGCGMNEEVRGRVFEPFFTTKEAGKGTGLGLATVFGIVRQSGGDIHLESAPEQGSVFCIFLPQTNGAVAERRDMKQEGKGASRGGETVLLVDDEDAILRIYGRVLGSHGFTVLSASNGPKALAELQRHGKPVDLLVTDVIMPGMGGRELAQTVARKALAPRTLYLSGYSNDVLADRGILEPGLAMLSKPFTPGLFLRKVREVLDSPADQARA